MKKRLLCAALFLSMLIFYAGETRAESFVDKILRITGISATTGQQRPSGDVKEGDIWIISLPDKLKRSLTSGGGYRSPVFSSEDKKILALQGEDIVQISVSGGTVSPLYSVKGIMKLVGFDRTDPQRLLFIAEDDDGRALVGLITMTDGRISYLPYDSRSRDDRRMISNLKGWGRTVGDKTIYVETETKSGMAGHIEWTDVKLKQGSKLPQNLSRCDGVACGQPSISHDGGLVVFIRQGR